MPSEIDALLRRLIGGDESAPAAILDAAASDGSPTLLVAAALVAPDPSAVLAQAHAGATTTRDRQLVAIAAAYLAHDDDRLDVLVRDHLADHPDNLLAAWIAAQHADDLHADEARPDPARTSDPTATEPVPTTP